MNTQRKFNVLFICTSNSSRSIMAEAMLNSMNHSSFHAFSAGSQPKGEVNPNAIKILQTNHVNVEGLRSKDWKEFAESNAPHLDFVFTVCDKAAGEACPVWPGQPMTAHWGVEDPADATEADWESAFETAYARLAKRAEAFLNLPFEDLSREDLAAQVKAIGTLE